MMTSANFSKKISEILPRGATLVISDHGTPSKIQIPYLLPNVRQVIFDEEQGVTVVLWEDGDKVVVRCGQGETFDRYTGFMAAVCKKMFGGTTTAKKIMNKADRAYQAKLKAEADAKAKEKAAKEAEEKRKKDAKRKEEIDAAVMDAMVKNYLMKAEAKKRAEAILAQKNGENA